MRNLWKMSGIFGIMFGLCSGPGLAQGVSVHIGAQTGSGMSSTSISDGTGTLDGLSARSRSPDFGLHAGIDFKVANSPFLVGAFGEYMWRDTSFKIEPGFSVSFGNVWTLGARAGYVLNGGMMPYILAGYRQTELGLPAGVPLDSKLKGWMLGGGLEIPLAKQVTLSAEGRWTKYDKVDLTPVALPLAGVTAKTDELSGVLRLNVNLN